ncbi:MAG: cation diffusion facilitator family transporter [Campylobacterales bacterium]
MSHSDHSHNHTHHHHGDLRGKNLFIAIILNLIITISQVIGGLISGSMALLADALHNFSDVGSLIISFFATKISKKSSTSTRTFGYKRAEIIAALINSMLLVGVGVFLIAESFDKLLSPEPIESSIVIWLAILSITLNLLSVLLLHKDSKDSLNIKSAYLHLLTDVMSSIALLVGGLCMMFFGWYFLDPIISIGIALYLIYSSYGIIKESMSMIMQFAPVGIDSEVITQEVEALKGIKDIHHIHIWSLDEHSVHLEAHIGFEKDISISEFDTYYQSILDIVKKQGITHLTLQPEFGECRIGKC